MDNVSCFYLDVVRYRQYCSSVRFKINDDTDVRTIDDVLIDAHILDALGHFTQECHHRVLSYDHLWCTGGLSEAAHPAEMMRRLDINFSQEDTP